MTPVSRCARALADGGVVGFPTETVYGLGASIRHPEAIAEIFAIKARPLDRALIVHVRDAEGLEAFGADPPAWARRAATALWPGPLTLVVPAGPRVPSVAIGGGETVGIRAVDHPRTAALFDALEQLEGATPGIVGTSANRHGSVPATRAAHVAEGLGPAASRLAAVLDGGPCTVGIESTVVGPADGAARILRPGGVSAERLAAAAEVEVRWDPPAPAQVAGVRWIEPGGVPTPRGPSDVVLSAGPAPADLAAGVRWLRLAEDLESRSRELFARLRAVPSPAAGGELWIERAPEIGLGPAINARLDRWVSGRALETPRDAPQGR